MNIYYLKNKKRNINTYYLNDQKNCMYSNTFTIQFSKSEFNLIKRTAIEFWEKEQIEIFEKIYHLAINNHTIDELRDYSFEVKNAISISETGKELKRRLPKNKTRNSFKTQIINEW